MMKYIVVTEHVQADEVVDGLIDKEIDFESAMYRIMQVQCSNSRRLLTVAAFAVQNEFDT